MLAQITFAARLLAVVALIALLKQVRGHSRKAAAVLATLPRYHRGIQYAWSQTGSQPASSSLFRGELKL